MLIDILFLIILVMAIFKGLRRGLIISVFSIVAFIVGLAAALKLSVVVAGYLADSTNISAWWLPVISFIIVFILAVFLIQLAARALEKVVEGVLLGWVNRLGGVILYIVIYMIILSILLFYAVQMKLIPVTTVAESRTYEWVAPWGPRVINAIGKYIPIFKDMFLHLENFFTNLAERLQHN